MLMEALGGNNLSALLWVLFGSSLRVGQEKS
jgi:hypothetical protein